MFNERRNSEQTYTKRPVRTVRVSALPVSMLGLDGVMQMDVDRPFDHHQQQGIESIRAVIEARNKGRRKEVASQSPFWGYSMLSKLSI